MEEQILLAKTWWFNLSNEKKDEFILQLFNTEAICLWNNLTDSEKYHIQLDCLRMTDIETIDNNDELIVQAYVEQVLIPNIFNLTN